ncbi:hypothetical protein PA598K_06080 [Paenibacillus sp. 598K]|nr:hypothetical protein PA598K_06080 [Paenibacillus sp. 598K]
MPRLTIREFGPFRQLWLMPDQASVFISVSLKLIAHIVGIAADRGKYVVYALSCQKARQARHDKASERWSSGAKPGLSIP